MRKRRLVWSLTVVAAFVTVAWWANQFSHSAFPIELHCDKFITRPQVAALDSTALILAPNGTIWGWGQNNSGLLGPAGTRARWNAPRRLAVGSDWVSLAATFTFAVGTKADGTLWGWGWDARRLPNNFDQHIPPGPLAPGTNWLGVAAGVGHVLAWRADGTLWGWRQNERGQVGDGTTNWSARPVMIGTNRNWTTIAAGSLVSLGLQSDGSLWQWGFVHAGYDQGPDRNLNQPTRVGTGTNWTAIFANNHCHIARQRDGSLWVWGPNADWLYGNTNRYYPSQLRGDKSWVVVRGKGAPAYGLTGEGKLWCGRYDNDGQWSGDQVGGRADWVNLWSGGGTFYGSTRDDTLWTWGMVLREKSRLSEATGAINNWLREHVLRESRLPAQQYFATPWALMRFSTNSVSPAK